MIHRPARAAGLLAAAALTLTACSGGDQPVETSNDTTSSSEPTASSTTDEPQDGKVTPPGTQLAFGDPAVVAYEDSSQSSLLKIRVDSAEQGSLDDFEGFDLDDPYKRRGSYYYVRVAVRNAGKGKVGDVPVPLWGLSGEGTLLQVVQFRSAFSTCPTEPLPEDFGPGDRFETCLVYLSPNRGSLEGVSYRPTADFSPIEWRGKVKTLPTKKPGKGSGKGGGQGSGQGDGQDG